MVRALYWTAVVIHLFSNVYAQDMPPRDVPLSEILETFGLLESPKNLDFEKIALGARLFHDPRLSVNNQVSCASCHIISQGGDDNRQFSIGVSGKPSTRNSPSVLNLENHIAYFWDGRADDLTDQIDGPIHHPDEMGTDWPTVIRKLNADKEFSALIRKSYGTVDADTIKDAITVFERSLITNDSPFDRMMRGDSGALTAEAKRGLSRFVDYGCASCHQGPAIGGNVFQHFGVYDKELEEKPMLKVPSLRNVAVTAPYFHDGHEARLRDAVQTMARVQLGRETSEEETEEIVAFLRSLTDARFKEGPTSGKRNEK